MLDKNTPKTAVNFEAEKIKSYLKVVSKIENLQGHLLVLEKTFL